MNDDVIIVGRLNDSELRRSIDELTRTINQKTNAMAAAFESAMTKMENAAKNVGNVTKQNVNQLQKQQQNISALGSSYDQLANAMQKASGRSTIMETYDLQIKILIEDLREVRERLNVLNTGLNSGKAFQLEGDIKNATERAEQLMREIAALESKRESLQNILSPQGDAFRNYIDSLTKANPELERLNQQFREGNSLLQQQAAKEDEITRNINKQAEEKRKQLEIQNKLEAKQAKQAIKDAISMPATNVEELERKLARLKEIQRDLEGKGILSEAEINRVKKAVDKLRDSIDKINKTGKYTPNTTRDVLGMSENTIDEITKKMQVLNEVRSKLNVNTQRTEITTLNNEYKRLSKLQSEILAKNNSLVTSNRALASAFGYIRNRIVYALTLGAATQFTKQIYEIRGQYELLERSLGVLTNSFENGRKIFQELNEMAIKSPFTLIELGTAAKQLTAYNFAANEVVDVTRRLADISSALSVPMERLTYNLGQIRAQTVLTARDARDFANAGLPIVKSLSDYYTELEGKIVTTGEVYSRMSKKMVAYNDVMAVLYRMTDEGGKFFDFQAKQAQTLRVQLANLTLAYNNMLNEFGERNQTVLSLPLKALRAMLQNWQGIEQVIYAVAAALGAYKAAQLIVNAVSGTTNKILVRQIEAEHLATRTRLEKIAMTRTLSYAEQNLLNSTRSITQADYERILAEKKLTTYQAMRLVAMNKNNALLKAAMINTRLLTEEQVNAAAAGKIWGITLRSLGQGFKSLTVAVANFMKANAWMLLIAAATELAMEWWNAEEAIENVIDSIRSAAEESYGSINKYIASLRESGTQMKAAMGALTKEEGAKAWQGMREEIETSVISSKQLLEELEGIQDVNERINTGVIRLQRLEQAKRIIADIKEDAVDISQTYLWGMFGEGLVRDLQDYATEIKNVTEFVHNFGYEMLQADQGGRMAMHDLAKEAKEANKEIDKTFDAFWKLVSEKKISDPLQIAEMLEHVKAAIKKENPKIKDELEDMFDIRLDERLSAATGGAYDKNTTLWKIFMDDLKKYSSSTFLEIGDTLTESQKKAIDENVERYKESMPQYYEAIKKMVSDASKLKVEIDVVFNRKELTDFQKEFQERIGSRWELKVYMPKENQEVLEWAEELRGQRDKLIEQADALEKIDSEWSKHEARMLRDQANDMNYALDIMHQPREKEKKTTSGSKKDYLAEALKQEISLIKDMQSSYDALRKAGVDNFEAIQMAASGYEATLNEINKVLAKYGFEKFDVSAFAGKNVNDVLSILLNQRQQLIERGAVAASLKDLDVEIQKLTVDAKTYNMKKITDGLNNELSKLKEDYELMVELQANPELGSELVDLFGIDTTELPQNINDFMEKAQSIFEQYASQAGIDVSGIDFLKFDVDEWAKKSATDVGSEFVNTLKSLQNNVRDVVKSWKDEVISGTKELEYKLADSYGKIAIEQKKLAELQAQLEKEKDEQRRRYIELQIQEQENVIEELKKESVKLMPFYTRLFADTYNVSTKTLKKIIDDARKVMDNAVAEQNAKGDTIYKISETVIGEDGKENIRETNVSLEEYIRIMKQIDSLQDKVTKSNPWTKIMDSFSRNKETNEIKNRAEGFKELGQQISETGDALKECTKLMEAFGIKTEGSGLSEGINDVAESLGGLGNIVSGMGQMEAGDVVGGIKSMIGGITSIVTAWGDNHNKKINKQVEASEKTLKKLEIAYIEIEHSVEKALGGAEIKARKAAIANKELQLAELQRQLQLEQSRKKKDKDDDRIAELQSQIKSLKLEIKDMTNEVVDNLLGEDIKSAAESFVEAWVGAWREGEDVMEAMKGSFDDMIDEMIMKSLASRIVANHLRPIWDMVDQMTSTGSEEGVEISIGELQRIRSLIGDKSIAEAINDDLTKLYNALGITYGVDAEQSATNLSQLQQGIQGITEVTANALEAYMNGVSQQVYYQSELMTQIRDAVVMVDGDIQLGTQAQMLLQLQQSYQVQTAIQNILMGVLTPSGQSFFVELR